LSNEQAPDCTVAGNLSRHQTVLSIGNFEQKPEGTRGRQLEQALDCTGCKQLEQGPECTGRSQLELSHTKMEKKNGNGGFWAEYTVA